MNVLEGVPSARASHTCLFLYCSSEVTAAVARFDLSAAVPLTHATSSIAPLIVPITLGYFLFDLALLPFWEGTFKVCH